MNYYNEIKNKLIENEIYAKTKDYSKERNRVKTYFETGKLLYEVGSVYGEDIVGQYAKKLQIEILCAKDFDGIASTVPEIFAPEIFIFILKILQLHKCLPFFLPPFQGLQSS